MASARTSCRPQRKTDITARTARPSAHSLRTRHLKCRALHSIHHALCQRSWGTDYRAVPARRDRLTRLGDTLKRHRPALAEALRQDLGKSRAEAETAEIHPVRREIKLALRHLPRWARAKGVPTLRSPSSRVRGVGAAPPELTVTPDGEGVRTFQAVT